MTEPSTSSSWFQHFIAPLVVGIVVLLGQSFLQPIVAERVNARTERWNAKRNAFAEVLRVVDKQFAANPFDIGPDAPKVPVRAGPPPEPEEFNHAYGLLMLFADDRSIVNAFLGCFGAREGQDIVWHEERVRLFQAMRKELGFEEIDITHQDVRFSIRKLQQAESTVPSKAAPSASSDVR